MRAMCRQMKSSTSCKIFPQNSFQNQIEEQGKLHFANGNLKEKKEILNFVKYATLEEEEKNEGSQSDMQPNKVSRASCTAVADREQVNSSQTVKTIFISKYFNFYTQINKTVDNYKIIWSPSMRPKN